MTLGHHCLEAFSVSERVGQRSLRVDFCIIMSSGTSIAGESSRDLIRPSMHLGDLILLRSVVIMVSVSYGINCCLATLEP